MKGRINPPTIADKALANVDPSNIVDLSNHQDLKPGAKHPPKGHVHRIDGKVLIASTPEERKHAEHILNVWWTERGDEATDEAKRRRKRETAEPYPVILWSERVKGAMLLPDPEPIFDSIVVNNSVNVIYGYMNQGKSAITETIALVSIGHIIEGIRSGTVKYKPFILCLEQPEISQQKWEPLLPLLEKANIPVLRLGEVAGSIDRDRLFATCKQQAEQGRDFCLLDNLNRFFVSDVGKEDQCKREMAELHECVFQHFPHNYAVHHTTKLDSGPVEKIPYMAGSHIIADYIQGNLVFMQRAWRDDKVVTFTHFKTKWNHVMSTYDGSTTLALRMTGWRDGELPYILESKNHSFQYWQKAKNEKDVLEEAAEMAREDGKKKTRSIPYIMQQLNVGESRAYELLNKHSNEQ